MNFNFTGITAGSICLLILVIFALFYDKNVVTSNYMNGANGTKLKGTNKTIVPNDPKDSLLFRSENPYNFDLSIPEKMPTKTIDPKDFTSQSLGKATIDMFRGEWVEIKEGEPYYSYDDEEPFCPIKNATFSRWSTCSEKSGLRVAKKYVADGLRPFNATQFMNFLQDKGPLYIIGDSLSGQNYRSLECMLEAGGIMTPDVKYFRDRTSASPPAGPNTGPARAAVPHNIRFRNKRIVVPTNERMQAVEIRISAEFIERAEDALKVFLDSELTWVDQVIKSNASYVVFNFGAWYSHRTKVFFIRSAWCNYTNWDYLKPADVLEVYEESFRLMLLPKLKKLVANGVIPIWRDTSPGGLWNPTIGDIEEAEYSLSWKLHPVYNRIGRRITQEARGLVLPIFDLSLARSEDHLQTDAFYTEKDLMHWCIHHSPYDVPHVWVQLLQNVLFDENGESHASISSRPRKLEAEKENNSSSSSSSSSSSKRVPNGLHDNYKFGKFDMRHAYSKSGESPCPCSGASNYFQCVANIKCDWFNSTSCIDKPSCNR